MSKQIKSKKFDDRILWHIDPALFSLAITFSENVKTALKVGSVPFILASGATIETRFQQLHAAERILSLKVDVNTGQRLQISADAMLSTAVDKLKSEQDDPEKRKIFAEQTIAFLETALTNVEFDKAAGDLLRQVIVMLWGCL
jgi:hypothetical protein